jgi:ABC-type Fe3+-hydroxamate transport system substrate-binding protein
MDHYPPKRIVSTVPSISELLFDLGLNEEIVGITKFCISPSEKVVNKERVGGTKNINIEKILQLKPDLIIGNKEENTKEDILELEKYFPIWMSDVNDLESAMKLISQIGEITATTDRANPLTNLISDQFRSLSRAPVATAAYLIWNNPIMVAGGDTFINDMLQSIGLLNVFANQQRYPTTSIGEIKNLNPDLIILSSEPFPFNQEHAESFAKSIGSKQVILVDGTYFSWYGSRMAHAPRYFKQILEATSKSIPT